jgi:predicted MFS family arabinose efflux permease
MADVKKKSSSVETRSRAVYAARMSKTLVFLMAAGSGLTVANIYYAQPLLETIRQSFGMSVASAGLIITASQLGFALGLAFLVPLGDLMERRVLVVSMTAGISVCLAGMALAPFSSILLAAALMIGALSVVAQILVAFAATLAGPAEGGQVVGTVMSGLLLGILLARTAAGYLAQLEGWRAVFGVASGLMVVLAAVFYRGLPAYRSNIGVSYWALMRSIVSLLMEEPVLRLRAFYGAIAFGSFSVLWTPLALLLSQPPYQYSSGTIGIFGLIGVAGVLAASLAGRMADMGWTRQMTGITSVLLALSWLPLKLGDHSVLMLVFGILALDLAVQGLHITNQSEIYSLRPDARSRITSAYMAGFFAGGVFGSALSSFAYAHSGWRGVCLVGAGFGMVATVLWLLTLRRRMTEDGGRKTGDGG